MSEEYNDDDMARMRRQTDNGWIWGSYVCNLLTEANNTALIKLLRVRQPWTGLPFLRGVWLLPEVDLHAGLNIGFCVHYTNV